MFIILTPYYRMICWDFVFENSLLSVALPEVHQLLKMKEKDRYKSI